MPKPHTSASTADRRLALVLLAPAAILLSLLVVYPIGRLFYQSLLDLRLTDRVHRFVGLQNFADVLRDPAVRHSACVTLVLVAVTVPGSLIVGLALALAGNLKSRWRWPVRLSILMPWALPPTFVGMIFAWFFQTEHGVVNDLIIRLGGKPIAFLLSGRMALAAVSLASIWKASSFVALLLIAGLQSVDDSLVEVAVVEGATRWQRFRYIILPALLPSIWVSLIFRTLAALQTFDIAYAMTLGGPGRATETLAVLIDKTTIEFMDVGYGSAMAVVLLGASFLLIAPYLRRIHQQAA